MHVLVLSISSLSLSGVPAEIICMIASLSYAAVPDLLRRVHTIPLLSVNLHKPEMSIGQVLHSQIPALAGLVICDPQVPQINLQSPIHMEKLDAPLGALRIAPDGNKEEACCCHLVLFDLAPFRLARV
jgi:hypothetical protein